MQVLIIYCATFFNRCRTSCNDDTAEHKPGLEYLVEKQVMKRHLPRLRN